MGQAKREQFDWQEEQRLELEDPHNETGMLDFMFQDSPEHPEWEIDEDMTSEELARIDSDAEIFDYRINGYA